MSLSKQSQQIITHRSQKSPAEILAYWTPERMARAQPLPAPTLSMPRTRHEEIFEAADEVFILPGRLPLADEQNRDAAGTTLFLPEDHAGPEVIVTTKVTPPRLYDSPYRCAGKVFFVREGVDRVGSASVVGMSGLLTAGHMLYNPETERWADEIVFAPAFYNGNADRYGLWVGTACAVPVEWDTGAPGYDLGWVSLAKGGHKNQEIGNITGWLGIVTDLLPQKQRWAHLGYPCHPLDGHDFDGENMWRCDGDFLALYERIVFKEGNMTGGSSGGPWLRLFAPDGEYPINGVQAGDVLEDGDRVSGSPYFGRWVITSYKQFFGSGQE
jgi:V8-like Glu-specific endopeptidase